VPPAHPLVLLASGSHVIGNATETVFQVHDAVERRGGGPSRTVASRMAPGLAADCRSRRHRQASQAAAAAVPSTGQMAVREPPNQ
jgi:hypothetical protein